MTLLRSCALISMLGVLLCCRPVLSGELLVIGAGQGRTGTDSLRLALNNLGVGPTYAARLCFCCCVSN